MNQSSLKLSEELKELSGWEYDLVTGYSLGYLLRKLPSFVGSFKFTLLMNTESTDRLATVGYQKFASARRNSKEVTVHSHPTIKWQHGSLEDAACALAIELIKQGILKPEVKI